MCLGKTHYRASVVEFVRLIDDVEELKQKMELVRKKYDINFYYSTDDECWKIREPKDLK